MRNGVLWMDSPVFITLGRAISTFTANGKAMCTPSIGRTIAQTFLRLDIHSAFVIGTIL